MMRIRRVIDARSRSADDKHARSVSDVRVIDG